MSNVHQGQTGPKSSAGKKISSMNSLKTGLFARSTVLPFEDEMQYKRHCKQVMKSLDPENPISHNLAQQIADSLWRAERFELRSSLKRKQVMGQLTPQQVAAFLGIEGKRQERAPDFLLTPNYHIKKKDLATPKKCLAQYEHLLRNVKGVANYEAVWRQYKDLFFALNQYMKLENRLDLLKSDFTAVNLAWQQRPKDIEAFLEEMCDLLWYQVHFEELRLKIRVWMSSWYFLQARDTQAVTQIDEMLMKERRHCQSLLETYMKLRKSTQEHIVFEKKYLNNAALILPTPVPKEVAADRQEVNVQHILEENEME